jgi:hypothetical protein
VPEGATWDPDDLDRLERRMAGEDRERESRESRAARLVGGSEDPTVRAERALRRSGHANALRGRELHVLPGGTVVARRPETASPLARAGTSAPRLGRYGPSDAVRVVLQAPGQLGNAVTNAATGGSGDTALGRMMGALFAGLITLEVVSLFAHRYFNLGLGPIGSVVAAQAAPSGNAGAGAIPAGSTSAQNASQNATGPQGTAPHALAGTGIP